MTKLELSHALAHDAKQGRSIWQYAAFPYI